MRHSTNLLNPRGLKSELETTQNFNVLLSIEFKPNQFLKFSRLEEKSLVLMTS